MFGAGKPRSSNTYRHMDGSVRIALSPSRWMRRLLRWMRAATTGSKEHYPTEDEICQAVEVATGLGCGYARNLSTTLVVYVVEEFVHPVDEPVVVGLRDHVSRVRKDGDFQVSAVLSVFFDVFWFEQGAFGTAAY